MNDQLITQPASIPLAISPCPNDTLGFYAAITARIRSGTKFKTSFHDIHTLNSLALKGFRGVVKISASIYDQVKEEYLLSSHGAAFGSKMGPLLVSHKPIADISSLRVAIPGATTSAYRAVELLYGKPKKILEVPYFTILELLQSEQVDAGIIIHESRFLLQNRFFRKKLSSSIDFDCVIDIGREYKKKFASDLPLGVVVIHKSVATERVQESLCCSFQYAKSWPGDAMHFARRFAQEKKPSIIRQHLHAFVSEETYFLSSAGRQAITQFGSLHAT
jgi:1,4-dihydroxy-6-naphthoate synthase